MKFVHIALESSTALDMLRSRLSAIYWVKISIFYHGKVLKNDELRKTNNILSKISIIVIRVSNGELAMSKPCSCCTDIMKKLGIKKIYYSTGDKRIFECERIQKLVPNITGRNFTKFRVN